MKKITLLFFIATLSSLSALAQYNFTPIAGPTNVVNGAAPTINLNDVGNSTAVTAGVYLDFIITVDWADDGTGTAWSSEADITVTTAAGSVLIDPATSGSAGDGNATTLTFSGNLAGAYDPSVDGTFDIIPNQSWGGSSADWSNIAVTINLAPACIDPSVLTATAITSTGANLGWTTGGSGEADWEIVVQAPATGVPAGAGTSTVGANPYSAGSLTPATDYEFYVRADCGGSGFSGWAGPFAFTTACATFTPDYTNDFTTFPGNCWEEGNDTDIVTGPNNTDGAWNTDDFLNNAANGSSARINIYGNTNQDWLVSPTFDLSADGYELKFDVGAVAWNGTVAETPNPMGSDDEVHALISNDNGATWIALEVFNVANAPSATGDTKIYDLTGYISTTTKFAFWATAGAVNDTEDLDFFIDGFVVRTPPSCPDPTALLANNFVAANFADISWAAAAGATGYNWEIQPQGTAQGTPSPIDSGTIATTNDTATNLVDGIDYTLYVQSDCGGPLGNWVSLDFSYLIPPSNNDCATPIALTPGANFAANSVVGTLVGTSDSGEIATTCSSYGGGDIWYSVVVPADGNITIETNNNSSTVTDTGMEVYSGACGGLTLVECDDDDSADGFFSLVDLTGRTPGETLLIRVWEYGGGTEDTIQVSAYNVTLSIDDLKIFGFELYPNPVDDRLTVSAKNEIKELSVVNMLGQTVRVVTPNSRNYQLDFSDLTSGIYFVKAIVNDTEGTFRIVKK